MARRARDTASDGDGAALAPETRLRFARDTVADLVLSGQEWLLPLFDRLEAEAGGSAADRLRARRRGVAA